MSARLCVCTAVLLIVGCGTKDNNDDAGGDLGRTPSLADRFKFEEKYRRAEKTRPLTAHLNRVDYKSTIRVIPKPPAQAGADKSGSGTGDAAADAAELEARIESVRRLLQAANDLAESNEAVRQRALELLQSKGEDVPADMLTGPATRRSTALKALKSTLRQAAERDGAAAAEEAVKRVFVDDSQEELDPSRLREEIKRRIERLNTAVEEWEERYGAHGLNIRAFVVNERAATPVSVLPYSDVGSESPLKAIIHQPAKPQSEKLNQKLEEADKEAKKGGAAPLSDSSELGVLRMREGLRESGPGRPDVVPLDLLEQRLGLSGAQREGVRIRLQPFGGRGEPVQPQDGELEVRDGDAAGRERRVPATAPTTGPARDAAEAFKKAVEAANAEAKEPAKPTVTIKKLQDFPLSEAQVGTIDLAGVADRGDDLVIQFRLTDPPTQSAKSAGASGGEQPAGKGDEDRSTAWEKVRFEVDRMDLSYELSGNLIFVNQIGSEGKQSGKPDDFVPAPAASVILHYRPRSDPWPYEGIGRFVSNLLEEVDPGIGLHVAALVFEESTGATGAQQDKDKLELGVGVGVQFTFFRDILQVGYGYNLMADDHPHYWFIGIGIFEALNEFGKLGRGRDDLLPKK